MSKPPTLPQHTHDSPNSPSSSSGHSSSETGESEEESEEEQAPLLKPVFLKKTSKTSTPASATEKDPSSAHTLARAEHLLQQNAKSAPDDDFGGVDDADDVDPEGEYNAWLARDKARRDRDRQKSLESELEKDEAIRRRLQAQNAPDFDQDKFEAQRDQKNTEKKSLGHRYNPGVFRFAEDQNQFLKRDYSQVDGDNKVDHSRPTRARGAQEKYRLVRN